MNNCEEKKIFWIWLSRLSSISCAKKEKLLNKYDSPEKIWNLKEKELHENEYLTDNNISEIQNEFYRSNLLYR